ncbi:MAG: hypothetical protein F6J93_27930 [Oscillatoria sp. SIO1A7]|nr:hypothetical protein [Oscillatoria sp. SIO1A7]
MAGPTYIHTLNPTPHTPHPSFSPYTPYPTPYTPHPSFSPYTPHPTPYTPHPRDRAIAPPAIQAVQKLHKDRKVKKISAPNVEI